MTGRLGRVLGAIGGATFLLAGAYTAYVFWNERLRWPDAGPGVFMSPGAHAATLMLGGAVGLAAIGLGSHLAWGSLRGRPRSLLRFGARAAGLILLLFSLTWLPVLTTTSDDAFTNYVPSPKAAVAPAALDPADPDEDVAAAALEPADPDEGPPPLKRLSGSMLDRLGLQRYLVELAVTAAAALVGFKLLVWRRGLAANLVCAGTTAGIGVVAVVFGRPSPSLILSFAAILAGVAAAFLISTLGDRVAGLRRTRTPA
jgi:hypothetical protein